MLSLSAKFRANLTYCEVTIRHVGSVPLLTHRTNNSVVAANTLRGGEEDLEFA